MIVDNKSNGRNNISIVIYDSRLKRVLEVVKSGQSKEKRVKVSDQREGNCKDLNKRETEVIFSKSIVLEKRLSVKSDVKLVLDCREGKLCVDKLRESENSTNIRSIDLSEESIDIVKKAVNEKTKKALYMYSAFVIEDFLSLLECCKGVEKVSFWRIGVESLDLSKFENLRSIEVNLLSGHVTLPRGIELVKVTTIGWNGVLDCSGVKDCEVYIEENSGRVIGTENVKLIN